MRAISNNWGKKVVSAVVSASLVATMVAIAPGSVVTEQAYAAADTSGYVTCSAFRAAEPTPEILGLTGVSTNTAWGSELGALEWTSPYYYLMGTSEYNSNPNPYIINAITNNQNGNQDAKPTLTYDSRKGGPTAAMYEYGVNEDNTNVWNLLPDVILGTNNGQVNYTTSGYADKAAAATDTPGYNPIGVTYTTTDIYTMIDSVYDLAEAGDYVAATTNKELRYGSAVDIAEQYEAYVKGTQGYILQQLATTGASKKTVVSVCAYDETTDTFTTVKTGVSEGTSTANRYLEATEYVATNIGDTQTTITRAELENADLIMVGGQSGQEVQTSLSLLDALGSDLQQKTFWVDTESVSNSAPGSLYGTVMNSVDNAQNYGRILGCLYPEYIDQDQWICYYYDNFYHVKSDKLADAIDNAMDLVRNWDSDGDLTNWTVADAEDYNEASVQAKLDAGMKYLSTATGLSDNLKPSDTYTASQTTTTTTTVSYTDLVNDGWSTDAINEMTQKGLMSGYSGTTNFGYGDTMTRAQFATILWRYANSGVSTLYTSEIQASTRNTTGLSDVEDGAYYTAAANWAVSEGLMGVGTSAFNPEGTITMEEMVTIIARYKVGDATAKATDTSVLTSGAYTDGATAASSWSANYLAWGINNNLFTGSDNGNGTYTIGNADNILRQRAAKLISNALAAGIL
jgi:hypothetical protein